MNDIRFLYAILLACAFSVALFWTTKALMKWRKIVLIFFYVIFTFHQALSFYGINNSGVLKLEWSVAVAIIGLLLVLGQKENPVWNSIYFMANVLLIKVFCNLGKFVFLSIYCGFNTEKIFEELSVINKDIFLVWIILYIPAACAASFFWKSMQMLQTRLLHVISGIMAIAALGMERMEDWKEIVIVMPAVMALLFLVVLYRMEKENEREKQLFYHKELEKQMLQKDKELEELRREVEKYYIKAGEKEGGYHAQVMQKIDHAKSGEYAKET